DAPQGFRADRRAAENRTASLDVAAAAVPFRDESRVDVRFRVKPAVRRRGFLREDEELAPTPRTPDEPGERVDDRFLDVRIPVQDEQLSLPHEDMGEGRRHGLPPRRARSPCARRASPRVVGRPSISTRVASTSPRICRARRTPASVSAYTRTFRVCPRRRASRASTKPWPWRAFRVRGTWLRSSRAPSAIPAWVPSRPGSRTFQNAWRWSRTRSVAVSSTSVLNRSRLLKSAAPDSQAS